MDRIRKFLQETRAELAKVTWPTPRQTLNLTVIVFIVGAAVGVYIFFFDILLSEVARFITGLAGAVA